MYCRYYRLTMPQDGAPDEADIDAFINLFKVGIYECFCEVCVAYWCVRIRDCTMSLHKQEY